MRSNPTPPVRIWLPIFALALLCAGFAAAQPDDNRDQHHDEEFNELFAKLEIEQQVADAIREARRPQDLIDKFDISYDEAKKILISREEMRLERGFFNVRDFQIDPSIYEHLIFRFSPRVIGKWKLLPYPLQSPTTGNFKTAHAAVLRNGKVLFLPRNDTTETVVWDDPTDEVNPHFVHPSPQPTDWLWCSGHTFLGDGRMLAVGGGGNSAGGNIDSGWLYNPVSNGWTKSADTMAERRWYPTALTLGDGRVFIASGLWRDSTEIYNPATDSFTTLTGPASNPTGANRLFPETYPGLHLMPGGELFYSRTGWGHGREEPAGPTAMFKFTSTNQGEWTDIASPMDSPDRTEGMSVTLLDGYDAKVLTIGGGDAATSGRNKAEVIDFSVNPPTYTGHPAHLPDQRFNVNAVLLPNGEVLVVGGRPDHNTPALLYNPASNSFRNVARVNYRREYHAVAVLLPSGKVAATGGDYGNTLSQQTSIEVYEPPYLHQTTPQPSITTAPKVVAYGQTFNVTTPEAQYIDEVVFMRPMSVTHHTDTEQRRVELSFTRSGGTLKVKAPPGSRRNVAPPGYYMMFLLRDGVPSEARFVRLGCPKLVISKIDFRLVNRISDFKGNVRISAVAKNIGTDFEGRRSGALVLYEDDREVARAELDRVAAGRSVTVSYDRDWNASSPAEGEFPPTYRAAVVYPRARDLTHLRLVKGCWPVASRLERLGAHINSLFTR